MANCGIIFQSFASIINSIHLTLNKQIIWSKCFYEEKHTKLKQQFKQKIDHLQIVGSVRRCTACTWTLSDLVLINTRYSNVSACTCYGLQKEVKKSATYNGNQFIDNDKVRINFENFSNLQFALQVLKVLLFSFYMKVDIKVCNRQFTDVPR